MIKHALKTLIIAVEPTKGTLQQFLAARLFTAPAGFFAVAYVSSHHVSPPVGPAASGLPE
ncbi:hypothetical protein [uncultured Tateyamaria sp.]|uniref:hypothetical protein n=1 Tax=uncultured Tateyamaria sp. TaxID=455651 RepID=UPI002604A02E|nr:hypothetical protein [uncultured Tateyamaria sp.]